MTMNEPSILDYLKSRLNPWSKEKIQIPAPGEKPELLGQPSELSEETQPGPTINIPREFPWRTLAALLLGLFAQFGLEPPARNYTLAIALYAFAVFLLVWAWFVGEFRLQPLPENQPQPDSPTFNRRLILIGLALGFFAFLFFGPPLSNENSFNFFNLVLWLAAIASFVYGAWVHDHSRPPFLRRVTDFVRRDVWQFKITPWAVLLIATFALAAFFRFYNLSGVIGEPFSDHAEKILDLYDVTQGHFHVFFERNTGREFLSFYWLVMVGNIFQTGLSFLTLKLGMSLVGFLTLPYIYLLGKEIGGKRVAFFALLIAGVAYWPNTISRVGLRFAFYPVFTAPVLYHLIRGLRVQKRNDFILAGLFLGLGLNGYSPYRFVPVVVVIAVALYLLHAQSRGYRKQTLIMLAVIVLVSVLVCVPLGRYAIDKPMTFSYRMMTRLTGDENAIQGSLPAIFLSNFGQSMLMFNWNNGDIWVHSIPGRPALDVVSAMLFLFGYFFLLVRYLQKRHWVDLFLFLSVPLLMMPSILSFAFPGENPSLNRTGGALVVVFVIVGLALDGLYTAIREGRTGRGWGGLAVTVVTVLLVIVVAQNYSLEFNQYSSEFMERALDTSDMGKVIDGFVAMGNSMGNAWVVPYPYWVDTRLVGIQAGYPTRDVAMMRDNLPATRGLPGNKLFIVKQDDSETIGDLYRLYPNSVVSLFQPPSHQDQGFWVFYIHGSQPPITAP